MGTHTKEYTFGRIMTQQLKYDFSTPPVCNPDFFFPLDLKLDPEEKENFIKVGLPPYRKKVIGHALSNVGNADEYFAKTKKNANEYVKPLGLEVRKMTLFLSDENQTSHVVHCDGVRGPDGIPTMLEARLSYYEIAEAPGAIRWWDGLKPELTIHGANEYTQERISCIVDWADDIRKNKLKWSDVPQPVFDVVTSVPSALLRTNQAHHVIQGPGLRVTVSCQLVFAGTRRPEGVWKHIQQNIHLLK